MKIPPNFLQLTPDSMVNGETIQLHPSYIYYNRKLETTYVHKFTPAKKGHGWYLTKKNDEYFLYIENDSAGAIRIIDYIPQQHSYIQVQFSGVYEPDSF